MIKVSVTNELKVIKTEGRFVHRQPTGKVTVLFEYDIDEDKDFALDISQLLSKHDKEIERIKQ